MASTGIGRKRENIDIESEENIVIESERKEENIEEESKKNEETVRRWASMALCWGGRCLKWNSQNTILENFRDSQQKLIYRHEFVYSYVGR